MIALGRKAWLFAGSDRGGERAAVVYSLIATAKLNNVDPQAWLADVLARIADPTSRRAPALALAQASHRSLRRGCVKVAATHEGAQALNDAGAGPLNCRGAMCGAAEPLWFLISGVALLPVLAVGQVEVTARVKI
jgi:hypothetical protein